MSEAGLYLDQPVTPELKQRLRVTYRIGWHRGDAISSTNFVHLCASRSGAQKGKVWSIYSTLRNRICACPISEASRATMPYYEQGAAESKLGFIFSRRTKSNSQSYLVLDHSISHSTPEDAYSNTHANGRSVPSSFLCAFWRRTSRSRFTAYIRLMWNMLRRLKVACYRSRISEIGWSLVRYASFQHSVDLRVIIISKPILVWFS